MGIEPVLPTLIMAVVGRLDHRGAAATILGVLTTRIRQFLELCEFPIPVGDNTRLRVREPGQPPYRTLTGSASSVTLHYSYQRVMCFLQDSFASFGRHSQHRIRFLSIPPKRIGQYKPSPGNTPSRRSVKLLHVVCMIDPTD